MFNEIWRDIPDYEGLYQASDQGRIRNTKTGRILAQKQDKRKWKKYWMVGLMKNGKRSFKYVSRLVYSAFNGPIPKGMEVNHISENKDDNSLSNLNLMSREENMLWGTGIERRAKAHYKKVYQYDLEGNFIREWPSVKSVQEETGYRRANIANCCRKLPHNKTAYGFIWRYEK